MHAVSTDFAKPTPYVKMTSHCDVTNGVCPVVLATISHSTAQYYNLLGGHTIKQSSRASAPDLFTPLTVPHCKKCPWKKFKWSGNRSSHTKSYFNKKSL